MHVKFDPTGAVKNDTSSRMDNAKHARSSCFRSIFIEMDEFKIMDYLLDSVLLYHIRDSDHNINISSLLKSEICTLHSTVK